MRVNEKHFGNYKPPLYYYVAYTFQDQRLCRFFLLNWKVHHVRHIWYVNHAVNRSVIMFRFFKYDRGCGRVGSTHVLDGKVVVQ